MLGPDKTDKAAEKAAEKALERCLFVGGTKIFSQGDQGDAAYVIESGRVAIYKQVDDRKVHLATLIKGALFGEMAVIDGSPRMASAVALDDAVLVRIPALVVQQKMQKVDPFIKALINMLIENLRNVHKVYVARPRSVQDFVKVLAESSDVLRQYANVVDFDSYSSEIAHRLETIRTMTEELPELLAKQADRRLDNLPNPEDLPD